MFISWYQSVNAQDIDHNGILFNHLEYVYLLFYSIIWNNIYDNLSFLVLPVILPFRLPIYLKMISSFKDGYPKISSRNYSLNSFMLSSWMYLSLSN